MTSEFTDIVGEHIQLLSERAIFWPRRSTLFVADLHIGKAATFRAAGSPLPRGSTTHDLARLSRCFQATDAERLVVLGDLYHARAGQEPATMDALLRWRDRHMNVQVEVVRGNHDRRAHPSPSTFRFEEVEEGALDAPFVLAHHPVPSPNGYVLAGHLHPGVRLRSGAEDMKLPCFHVGEHVAVLPAFGSFTGLALVRPTQGDRVYAIADDQVICVT